MALCGIQTAIEYEHWLRIVTLVHYGGKELCLDVLHYKEGLPTNGQQLYNALSAKLAEFQKLLRKGVLKQDQYDLIFPTNQITDLTKFDITLYTLVISVMFGKKYKTLIDDLRQWRNEEFHKGKIYFTKVEFQQTWIDVTTMLNNHGLNLALVAGLQSCALDADSQFRKAYLEAEILRQDMELKDTKDKVSDTKQEVDVIKNDMADTKQEVGVIRKEMLVLKQNCAQNTATNHLNLESIKSFKDDNRNDDETKEKKIRLVLERLTKTGCLLSIPGIAVSKEDIENVTVIFNDNKPIRISSYAVTSTSEITYIELSEVRNWENRCSIQIIFLHKETQLIADIFNLSGDGNNHYKVTTNNTCIMAHPDGKPTNVHSEIQNIDEPVGELRGEFYKGAGICEKQVDAFESECKKYKQRYLGCNGVKRYPPSYVKEEGQHKKETEEDKEEQIDELAKLEKCIESCLKKDAEHFMQTIFTGYNTSHHLGFYDAKTKHSNDERTLLVLDSNTKTILRIRSATKETLKHEIDKCNSDLIALCKIFKLKIYEKGITVCGTVYCQDISREDLNCDCFINIAPSFKKFILTKDELHSNNFGYWWNEVLQGERKKAEYNFTIKDIDVTETFSELSSHIMVLMSMTLTGLPSFSPDIKEQIFSVFLNKEQLKAINSDHKKRIIIGPYGSGKSLVGLEIVKRLIASATCKTKIFYTCADPSSLIELEMKTYQNELSTENVEIVSSNICEMAKEAGVSTLHFHKIIKNLTIKYNTYMCHFILDEFDFEIYSVRNLNEFKRLTAYIQSESYIVLLAQSCSKRRYFEKPYFTSFQDTSIRIGFKLIKLKKKMRSTNNINMLINLAEGKVTEKPSIAYLPILPSTVEEIKTTKKMSLTEELSRIETSHPECNKQNFCRDNLETINNQNVLRSVTAANDQPNTFQSYPLKVEAMRDVDYCYKLLSEASKSSTQGRMRVSEFKYVPSTNGHNIYGDLPHLFYLPSKVYESMDILGAALFQHIKKFDDCDTNFTIICNDLLQLDLITYSLRLSNIDYAEFTPMLSRFNLETEEKQSIKERIKDTKILVTDNKGVRGMEVDHLITFADEDEQHTRHIFIETIARATVSLTLFVFPSKSGLIYRLCNEIKPSKYKTTGTLKNVFECWVKERPSVIEMFKIKFTKLKLGRYQIIINGEEIAKVETPHESFASFRSNRHQITVKNEDLVRELNQHTDAMNLPIYHIQIEGKIWSFDDVFMLLVRKQFDILDQIHQSYPNIFNELRKNDYLNVPLLHETKYISNNTSIIKYLIKHNVDVTIQDYLGYTCFHEYFLYDDENIEVLQLLYDSFPTAINIVNVLNETPLHKAVQLNEMNYVEWMLTNTIIDIDVMDNYGKTADKIESHEKVDEQIIKMIEDHRNKKLTNSKN